MQFFISIHTSGKEATEQQGFSLSLKVFQSTPPRRRRHLVIMDFSSFSYFNPRLREGGDNSTRLSINSCFVFQSTPPRRRRLFHLVNLLLYKEISIHASEKEATTAYDIHTQLFSFQSTPPRRRRLKSVTDTPSDV